METYRVGILGATGMVGQRFVTLLENHPWFQVVMVAASPASAGKTYRDAVEGRWHMTTPIPAGVAERRVYSVIDDLAHIAGQVDLVFSALDLDKETIRSIECEYAAAGVAVISNNSAHRWTDDIPMIMPEVNAHHTALIDTQRANRGWTTGCIAVKPNCSIQSYVSILNALKQFEPTDVSVTSLQAISGAGKTFATWPEMVDNVIPFIGGEEEKSEREPLKIWGEVTENGVKLAENPTIRATCIRVPVSDGHLAAVDATFARPLSEQVILEAITNYASPLPDMGLPSAPEPLIQYLADDNRPQTKLDREYSHGMGVSMGRLRAIDDHRWQFIALSHNTIRGAAGGAILMAELFAHEGYIVRRGQ
ncbi:MAG: aspartate-semialdehyde dehydrogenase [Candidatus Saccharimonadales bacterium]